MVGHILPRGQFERRLLAALSLSRAHRVERVGNASLWTSVGEHRLLISSRRLEIRLDEFGSLAII